MKRIAFAFLIIALFPQGLFAQDRFSGALEFGAGPSVGMFNVKGDTKTATGSASGANYHLRYTHYLKGGFGLYGEIGETIVKSSDSQYFGALNKADGGKYRYRYNNDGFCLDYSPLISVGGAYRKSFDAFDIVLRAGLGYGERSNDFGYERRSRDGSEGPQYFSYAIAGESATKDYLIDEGIRRYYYASALVVSASAQFVWKFCRRVYFFGEAGFDCSPSKYGVSVTSMGSKMEYDPINWVEAVSYADLKDIWTKDYSSRKVSGDSFGMGSHINFSIGIGVNFWKVKK